MKKRRKAVQKPKAQPKVVAMPGPQKLYDIVDGTVIDHVPAGHALQVLQVLGIIHGTPLMLSMGMNLSSRKMSNKDLVKVEGKLLTREEINKLALIAPGATINHISKGQVKEKFRVQVPPVFIGIVQCQNPNCISRNQRIPSKFITLQQKPLELSCAYCERMVEGEQVVLG